jgi:hypothetical protein
MVSSSNRCRSDRERLAAAITALVGEETSGESTLAHASFRGLLGVKPIRRFALHLPRADLTHWPLDETIDRVTRV